MCWATILETFVRFTTFVIFNMLPIYLGLGTPTPYISVSDTATGVKVKGKADDTLGTWTVPYMWGEACSQHANIAVKTSRLIDYECDIGCPLIRI